MNEIQYQDLIKKNKILVEYMQEHNLTIEDLDKLIDDINAFFFKVLADKSLYDAVRETIFHFLRKL